jgi:hypothetical protein
MTYPEDLEAPEADVAEQHTPADPGLRPAEPPSVGDEVPEWDAAEQHTPADPRDEPSDEPPALGDEVPEWDAAEQAQTVLIDDDYS